MENLGMLGLGTYLKPCPPQDLSDLVTGEETASICLSNFPKPTIQQGGKIVNNKTMKVFKDWLSKSVYWYFLF